MSTRCWQNPLAVIRRYEYSTKDRSRSAGSTAVTVASSPPSAIFCGTKGRSQAQLLNHTAPNAVLSSRGRRHGMATSRTTSVQQSSRRRDRQTTNERASKMQSHHSHVSYVRRCLPCNARLLDECGRPSIVGAGGWPQRPRCSSNDRRICTWAQGPEFVSPAFATGARKQ